MEPPAPVHVLPSFILLVDEDVDVRNRKEVVWAMTTRMNPARDTLLVEHSPIDYLDFALRVSGLGSKMGLDGTNQMAGRNAARMEAHDGHGCRRGCAYEGAGGCVGVVMQRMPAFHKETALPGF